MKVLGAVPTQTEVIAERFFDESGGMQLVLHAPFGGRINRAWGLALRKRFCRGFGFELQAAANEEAILFSLGPQNSFPLEEVFDYLHPSTARETLVQAVLGAPMFKTRWRWNVTRALLLERVRGGKRVAAPLLRMRADDLLAGAFPAALACPETLPGGDIEVPTEHPIVRQTLDDCLTEAMDVDGFLAVLRGLRDGSIRRRAVDTTEPSVFAYGILAAQPYAFLDDAPLEERRTQAVLTRRTLVASSADDLGALDPEAIRRVREEAWPDPRDESEVHEALLWMGFVTVAEGAPWHEHLQSLRAQRRVAWRSRGSMVRGRSLARTRWWCSAAASKPSVRSRATTRSSFPSRPKATVPRGRLATGVAPDGAIGRLLARIHRYTLDRLRKEIEPVTAATFLRFLAAHQHVDEEHRLDGAARRRRSRPLSSLLGFEIPAAAWEGRSACSPRGSATTSASGSTSSRLAESVAWGRLWGSGVRQRFARRSSVSAPRETSSKHGLRSRLRPTLRTWERMRPPFTPPRSRGRCAVPAGDQATHGLSRIADFDDGMGDPRGRRDRDMRQLRRPPGPRVSAGATLGDERGVRPLEPLPRAGSADWPAREYVTGRPTRSSSPASSFVVRVSCSGRRSRREKVPVPWRDLVRALRTLEARGEIRVGRLRRRPDGEQYALPDAVSLLRTIRDATSITTVVSAADPLNFRGNLTPEERVAPMTRRTVLVG